MGEGEGLGRDEDEMIRKRNDGREYWVRRDGNRIREGMMEDEEIGKEMMGRKKIRRREEYSIRYII